MIQRGRKKLLLATSLLVLALVAVTLMPERSSLDTTATPEVVPSVLQWRIGSSQEYDVLVNSSSLIGISATSTLQAIDVRMDGVLEFITLEVGAAGALVGMRLSSMVMAIADQSPDTDTNRELALPFRVRFALDGRIMAFEFPAAMTTAVRQVIENLLRMFQVTIQQGDHWVAQESNASGLYDAIYARTSTSTVVKKKQRYLDSTTTMAAFTTEVTSMESIQIGVNQDWISSMTLDETLITKNSNMPFSEVSNHATLQLRDAGNSPIAATGKWDFVAVATPASTQDSVKAVQPSLSREEAERQMDSSIAYLDTTVDVRTTYIHRLRDLMLMDGQLPLALLETLRDEQLADRTRADLYLVLQLAGTPEAQAVLNSVVTDTNWSAKDGLRAIVALGAVDNPTEETFENLWDTARSGTIEGDRRDLPATAALALGSLGKGLRAAENANYSSLRADLLDGASSASDAHQRAVFLLALGNTADTAPSMRSDIVPFLNDPAPQVRSAAANALGRLGTNQVADDLFKRLERERNTQVRGSIAQALATWESPSHPAIESVRKAIPAESDEKVRYNMALLLGNTMEAFPENRTALEQLLVTEQSKRIRQQVANSLYGEP